MRLMKFVILAMLCSSFIACSNDDNDTPKFDENFLKQTKWNGTFASIVEGEIEETRDITIYFITDNRGNYDFPNSIFHNIEFDYSVDDKLLNLRGKSTSVMNGDWILTSIENNKLTFRKGVASNNEYYTLEVTKSREKQGYNRSRD